MKIGESKELIICSYKQLYKKFENQLLPEHSIALFLTVSNIDHPVLSGFKGYLKIPVYDTEDAENPFSFKPEHGTTVKKFVDEELDFSHIYVCCDSGESRSTAMAAAILKYFGCDDKIIWTNPHYHPNLLVYSEQMSAFGMKVNSLKLKYLRYINERALKKAISGNR